MAPCLFMMLLWGWSPAALPASALPVLAAAGTLPAEDPPLVARTRKRLELKITLDCKDQPLKDVLEEIKGQTEISFTYDAGVSRNQAFTYTAKDKPLKEVFEEMFKDRGLGYVIHRKKNASDRYEGYIRITQGNERGDEEVKKASDAKATRPAPPPPDADRVAAALLRQAKALADEGLKSEAIEVLEDLLKKYPKAKAATEAKELLGKLKK
ncbi:MAG TPA: hypothetical protein PKC45_14150 [Gemmatales bacterium]|nr:hypothetical protein [Gemmatales bacterium]